MTTFPDTCYLRASVMTDLHDIVCERYDDLIQGLEIGGVVFGYKTENGEKLVVTSVRPNSFKPYSRDSTAIDIELAMMVESKTQERLAGDLHSHPHFEEEPHPSERDFETWLHAAVTLQQDFLGLLLTPSAQEWRDGYPHADWSKPPRVDAWLASEAGEVRKVPIVNEPAWLFDLRVRARQPVK